MMPAAIGETSQTTEPALHGVISFVIPNYNHARYLGDAIRSVLEQTYPHVEVIVVDDGSTDDSRSVVAEFGNRIRTIYQSNSGLSAARNTGVQAARGEYIALLDADDMVEPSYAEKLLSALLQMPDADGAYCGFRFVDQNNQPLPRVEWRVVAPDALYAALLNGNYWVPESLLARRACYLAAGEFDTSLRACEDWDVWLRFSYRYKLIGIDDILVRYRIVVGSMSSDPQRMLDNRLAVLQKHLGSQPQPPVGASNSNSTAQQAYAYAYLRTALEYWQGGDDQAGYYCLREAVLLLPELLLNHATFYELACTTQAKGSQGAVAFDASDAEARLFSVIDRLSCDPVLQLATSHLPEPIDVNILQSQGRWALAQLSYQAGISSHARRAMLAASKLNPRLLHNRAFLGLFARTLLSTEQMALLKRIASRG